MVVFVAPSHHFFLAPEAPDVLLKGRQRGEEEGRRKVQEGTRGSTRGGGAHHRLLDRVRRAGGYVQGVVERRGCG